MIYLYRNKLPNYEENTHYFFTNTRDYVSALGEPALSFEEDRYTLNGNIAEIQTPLITDVDNVTYIAWYNVGAWRFFFVRSAVYQSGYAIFTLDVDLWATNIARATLSNIRVKRCNRNVGIGVYDSIPVANSVDFQPLTNNEYSSLDFDESDLAILYVVNASTGNTSLLSSAAGSTTNVYYNVVADLEAATAEGISGTIDNAVSVVGAIYAVLAGAGVTNYDANVVRAYLVPSSVLRSKITSSLPRFQSKPPYVVLGVDYLTPTGEAAPFKTSITFNRVTPINSKVFAGTKYGGLELPRITSAAQIIYDFIVKQDGLQVVVRCGELSFDITEAFEIGITMNDGNVTSNEQIAKTLQTITGVASGVFQFMSGGVGYVSGAATVANALTGSISSGNARYVAGGDGVTTFRKRDGSVDYPFYMALYASVDNEAANARLYGAAFNQQVESIDEIFNADLLGTGSLTDTYFAAEVRVDGVQTDARDVITSDIRRGIYAVKL